MAWLRVSDNYNRRPEIHALDDGSYRALQCLIEAAESFDACGMAIDSYAVGFYPHARQKFRSKIGKLAERGLVHLLSGPEDRDHDCVSCQTRWEELRGEVGEELREKLGTSSTTSTQSSKTEPMWFCIRNFFDVALTPEQKRNTKQGNAKRQRAKRKSEKAAESRRDAQPPSHPPVPVPDPKLRIIDRVPQSEETEPPSAANPSTPSNGATDQEAGSWLRGEWTRRQQKRSKPRKWKPEYQSHLDSVLLQASEAKGDTRATMEAALDAFFEDPEQQKHGCVPPGLDWYFDRFAGPYLEQAEAAERKRRAEAAERRHQEAKQQAEEQHAREVDERARQQNGSKDGRGAASVALAELMQSITVGKG